MGIMKQKEIAEERNTLAHIIGILIDPIIVCLTLLGIIYLHDEKINNQSIILSAIAFAAMFPGKIYLYESFFYMANKIITKWTIVSIFVFTIGYLTDNIDIFQNEIIFYWFFLSSLLLILAHASARFLIKFIYSISSKNKNIIIVGVNNTGLTLANSLVSNPIYRINSVAYFDDQFTSELSEENINFIGSSSIAAEYCKKNKIDTVYICIPLSNEPNITNLLSELKDTTASIYYSPDIFVTDLIQGGLSHVDGIPIVSICETPLIGIKAIQKRIIDIVFSCTILLMLAPLLAWIAYKVKKSSPGPIIFVQKRYGLNGKSINVYKFRTMGVTEDGEKEYVQVTKNDARVTPFGAFLRKTSLDELPQFVNVLEGKMSIVGPRPHVTAVNEAYRKLIPSYMIRHKVKPGISGLAQINGFRGGDDLESMKGRIEFDLEYIRNWSIVLDLLIIFKTIFLFIGGDKNAH